MAKFIEHFQKVAHISGDSVERGHRNNIKTISAGISEKLVETRSFRFCARNGVGVFMDDFISALLRQFSEVVELRFCVLVAGGYPRINGRAFAVNSFRAKSFRFALSNLPT